MVSNTFIASVRKKEGLIFIDLAGEINSSAEKDLDAVYNQAAEDNPAVIVLNFSDVSYINSTGIALIVGLISHARKADISLCLYGLSEHYQEIFKVTRLSDFIQIFLDEASVLAAVAA